MFKAISYFLSLSCRAQPGSHFLERLSGFSSSETFAATLDTPPLATHTQNDHEVVTCSVPRAPCLTETSLLFEAGLELLSPDKDTDELTLGHRAERLSGH
jgi:hypothetical protein